MTPGQTLTRNEKSLEPRQVNCNGDTTASMFGASNARNIPRRPVCLASDQPPRSGAGMA